MEEMVKRFVWKEEGGRNKMKVVWLLFVEPQSDNGFESGFVVMFKNSENMMMKVRITFHTLLFSTQNGFGSVGFMEMVRLNMKLYAV